MKRTRLASVMLRAALAAASLLFWGARASAVPVTPGFDFSVDASLDTDGDSRWEDTVGTTGFDFELDSSPAVTRVAGVSSLPGISAAYDFPGGSIGTEAGALLSAAGTGTRRSFASASGDWTDEDVTIEVWFKPGNLTPTPANGQIIFEDGGSTGFGFFVDSNELRLRKMPGTGNVASDISATSGEFIQAVGTFDNAGAIELFINGTSVGTDNPSGGDWSGGDAAAVGTRGGSNTGGIGGGQSDTESFDGQIAIFRVYRDQVLSAAQVADNFAAIVGDEVFFDNDGADGKWETASNWSTSIEPAPSQNAYIGNGLAAEVSNSGEVAGTLAVGHTETTLPGQGTLAITAGSLSVTNDLTLADGNDGALNISGGTLAVGGAILDGAGTSTINFNGGTLAAGSTDITVDYLNINPATATANRTYTRSGGTLTVNQDLKLGGNPAGPNYRGNVNQNGGNVNVGGNLVFGGAGSTEGGGYNLNGGILTVSGDIIETASSVDAAQMHLNGGTLSMPNGASGSTIRVQRFSVAETTNANVTYTANAPITTTGTLAVGGYKNAVGVMIIDDSTFPVSAGNCRLGQGNTANGTLRVESDGTLTIRSGPLQIAGDLTDGTDKDTQGALIVGTAGGGDSPQVSVKGNTEVGVGGTGSLTMHSGTFSQLTGNLLIGKAADAFGTVLIDGGALAVTNTIINGNATTGTGLLHIVGDAASINTGGYTQNANSTLELDINGISPIVVSGDATLAGYLDVGFLTAPSPNSFFTILELTDAGHSVGGTFAGLPDGAVFAAGGSPLVVQIDYFGGIDDNDVVLHVLPEPATLSLLTLGGLALLRRRRRHRTP